MDFEGSAFAFVAKGGFLTGFADGGFGFPVVEEVGEAVVACLEVLFVVFEGGCGVGGGGEECEGG